jgi:ribosomal-protein-alanine N-acetyltransferase
MLRMARFPPDREQTRRWFEDHDRERLCGEAYRFAVELRHRFVGVVDIGEIDSGWGDIGYWFERGAWGMGYATEAAHAVVRFAFDDVQLEGLHSGHAEDNPASVKVLMKLGFTQIGTLTVESLSRGEDIHPVRYTLRRLDWASSHITPAGL